ncbi:MAG: 30S ribosomal protein S17 [Planctomycetota bacterium]|jgi:small subunit ribosomal protein S17
MTSTPKTTARRARKVQVGKVTSAKMDKSITVVVERKVRHPVYEKYVRRQTRLHAHDEKNEAKVGDTVEVMAARPISKLKRWRLVKIVAKAEK